MDDFTFIHRFRMVIRDCVYVKKIIILYIERMEHAHPVIQEVHRTKRKGKKITHTYSEYIVNE